MKYEHLGTRLRSLLLLVALIFGGLICRLVYLQGAMQQAVMAGAEIAAYHPYPPLTAPEELVVSAAGGEEGLIRVPSVLNARFAEAGPTLLRSGLVTEGYGPIEGVVVRQAPAPNESVRRGSAVKVWLQVKR